MRKRERDALIQAVIALCVGVGTGPLVSWLTHGNDLTTAVAVVLAGFIAYFGARAALRHAPHVVVVYEREAQAQLGRTERERERRKGLVQAGLERVAEERRGGRPVPSTGPDAVHVIAGPDAVHVIADPDTFVAFKDGDAYLTVKGKTTPELETFFVREIGFLTSEEARGYGIP